VSSARDFRHAAPDMLRLVLRRELARQFPDLGGGTAAFGLLGIIELLSLAGGLSHNGCNFLNADPQRSESESRMRKPNAHLAQQQAFSYTRHVPTVHREAGCAFYFYAEEGTEPPHVHVDKGDGTAKLWLQPVRLRAGRGFESK